MAKKTARNRRRYSPEMIEAAKADRARGMSIREIAAKLGTPRSTVDRWVKGVPSIGRKFGTRPEVDDEAEWVAPRKGGKCTKAVAEMVVAALLATNTRSCAARYAGVKVRTFNRWIEKGEKGEQPYAMFLAKVEEAETENQMRIVAKIASSDDTKDLKWLLEHRYGRDWGKRSVTVLEGGKVPISMRDETPKEDASARRERLAAASSDFLARCSAAGIKGVHEGGG